MQEQSATSNGIIFLIGFMGCGKSTAGKKMARRMNYQFLDLDQLIVQKTGMSIDAFFQKFGENAFREEERTVLHSLSGKAGVLIATGGGTPCFFDNMQWMNKVGKTIYLRLPAGALASRLTQAQVQTRPLVKGKTAAELSEYIEEKLAERAPFYEQAHIVFDGLHLNPGQLAERLSVALKG